MKITPATERNQRAERVSGVLCLTDRCENWNRRVELVRLGGGLTVTPDPTPLCTGLEILHIFTL